MPSNTNNKKASSAKVDGTTSRDADATDSDLVARCLAEDADAWDALVRRYSGLVFSVPLQLGLPRQEAEEVLQDTFVILYRRLHTVRDRERIGLWLAVTARRTALNRVTRGPATREVQVDAVLDAATPNDHPLIALVELENRNEVRLALQRLPARCRTLLSALFYEDPPPPYDEIALRIGCPKGSIGPTRLRCFEKLRRLLHRDSPR